MLTTSRLPARTAGCLSLAWAAACTSGRGTSSPPPAPVTPAPATAAATSATPTTAAPSSGPATLDPSSPIKEFGTMWTFDAPPLAYWKARYGFTPSRAWLDHVRLASVRIPGCSASVVSAGGLVMTNHHCARACVDAVSLKDTNYIERGFAARTLADEKQCPGMWADQLQSIEDVTARVRGAVTAAAPAAQVEQRNAAIERLQRECATATSLTCQVVTFYQGGMLSV